MADPISITLGVVPLVGLVIKSFAVLNKKLSTFMHYSSKVKRFQRRFRGQRRTFENECRILLSFAIDDATILLMEKDPAHESWADDSIDDCLKTKFGDSYGTCLETVQDIRETVEDIEIQLGGFDDLPECPVEGEKLKKTIKRLQDRVKVTFNESNYKKAIDDLKSANDVLTRLREQLAVLLGLETRQAMQTTGCKRPLQSTSRSGSTPILTGTATSSWTTTSKINRASKTLHEALADAWSCGQASHLQHLIKLLVAADCKTGEYGNEVDLTLAILCPANSSDSRKASMLSLSVRCQSRDWLEVPRPLSPAASSSDLSRRPRRKKRVRMVKFAGEGNNTEDDSGPAGRQRYSLGEVPQSCGPESCDLRCSNDICSDLTRKAHHHSTTRGRTGCLGHIDVSSDESFRHSFYGCPKSLCHAASEPNLIEEDNIVTLYRLLMHHQSTQDPLLSYPDRLRLACQLARAVLQYHATPWLPDTWRLGDLAFFYQPEHRRRQHRRQIRDEGWHVAESLRRTLHLGVEFSHKTAAITAGAQQQERQRPLLTSPAADQPVPYQMDGLLPSPPPSVRSSPGSGAEGLCDTSSSSSSSYSDEERLLLHGIDNLQLYSLGVALLQVDLWDGSAAGLGPDPEEVVRVRELANMPSRALGRRFRNIVLKCLRCDFGYGADLGRDQLKKAVHDQVVAQLEGMLERLDLEEGEGNH